MKPSANIFGKGRDYKPILKSYKITQKKDVAQELEKGQNGA